MKTILVVMSLLFLAICHSGYSQIPDHPRLLVTQDELNSLWTKVNQPGSSAAILWNKLKQRCDNAQQNTLSGDEKFYQYRQISMLAFAALLLRQSSDTTDLCLADSYAVTALDRCQTFVLTDTEMGNFPVAHRIMNLALVYDYLYDDLTFGDDLKTDFENKILQDMSTARTRIKYARNRFDGNFAAFNCPALLYGAITTEGIGTYPSDSAQVDVNTVKTWMFTNSESYIRRIFGQDGACVEGLHYGFVNLMLTLPCLQALTVREGIDWFHVDYIRKRLENVPQWVTFETLPFPETHTSASDDVLRPIMNVLNDTHNYGGEAQAGHDGYDPFDMIIRILTLSGLYADQDLGVWVFHQVFSSVDCLYEPTGNVFTSDQPTVEDFILAMLHYNDPPVPDPETVLAQSKRCSDRGLVYWRTGWKSEDIQFSLESASVFNSVGLFTLKHDQSDKNSFTLFPRIRLATIRVRITISLWAEWEKRPTKTISPMARSLSI